MILHARLERKRVILKFAATSGWTNKSAVKVKGDKCCVRSFTDDEELKPQLSHDAFRGSTVTSPILRVLEPRGAVEDRVCFLSNLGSLSRVTNVLFSFLFFRRPPCETHLEPENRFGNTRF